MEKMYGYKEKDVILLAQFINGRKGKTLTDTFNEFAVKHGKAKGTVRNLYYALAKASNKDLEFCEKYLDGKPIKVSNIESFSKTEEKELVKKIVLLKSEGKSVRSAIHELSRGDMKLALRYQNKYRNFVKNKKAELDEILREIKSEKGIEIELNEKEQRQVTFNELQFKRLKNEIDSLVRKISDNLRKENAFLKNKIEILEAENLKLNRLLYGGVEAKPVRYFSSHNQT